MKKKNQPRIGALSVKTDIKAGSFAGKIKKAKEKASGGS